MANIDQRIEKWKTRLLDLGKRNRLINYRETKRSNIKIISPEIKELYNRLVVKEELLEFPYSMEEDFNDSDETEGIIRTQGDLLTNLSIKDQQKTLRNLRTKAKTAIEEQGVNILYLSFGFLQWREIDTSMQILTSPIILVPIKLTQESITEPFVLGLLEDEIVINPTLVFKMENDFGLTFPDFDSDESDIKNYLESISALISKNKWAISYDIGLSLFSFLKINMYNDLENNKDKIIENEIIRTLSGDISSISTLPEEYNDFDHDRDVKPIDTF